MNVKEAISVLKEAKKIVIGYGINALSFEMDDALAVEAYGGFKVSKIVGYDDGTYEIDVAVLPIREGVGA